MTMAFARLAVEVAAAPIQPTAVGDIVGCGRFSCRHNGLASCINGTKVGTSNRCKCYKEGACELTSSHLGDPRLNLSSHLRFGGGVTRVPSAPVCGFVLP